VGSSEKSASFSINEPSTDGQGSSQTPNTADNYSNCKTGDLSVAALQLIVEQATASISGLFPHHCVAEIKIANDGTLSGSCSTTMYGDMELNTGTLSGKWNGNTNEVTFHLETQSVY